MKVLTVLIIVTSLVYVSRALEMEETEVEEVENEGEGNGGVGGGTGKKVFFDHKISAFLNEA